MRATDSSPIQHPLQGFARAFDGKRSFDMREGARTDAEATAAAEQRALANVLSGKAQPDDYAALGKTGALIAYQDRSLEQDRDLATRRLEAEQKAAETSRQHDIELARLKAGLDPKAGFVSVPGLGVYDTSTQTLISPYGSAGGGQPVSGGPSAGPAMPVAGQQPTGIPTAQAPTPPGLSPKGREDIAKTAVSAGREALGAVGEEASAAAEIASHAGRFLRLMEGGQDTGGTLLNMPFAETGARVMGDAELTEMYAIRDRLTPLMRQGMPGSASDRDVVMFQSATVGPEKPPETNRRIANAMIQAAENKQAEYEFKSLYFEKNGTLDGADRYWRGYLSANPIFDAGKDGYVLNDERKTWREYFGQSQPADAGVQVRDPLPPELGGEMPPGGMTGSFKRREDGVLEWTPGQKPQGPGSMPQGTPY